MLLWTEWVRLFQRTTRRFPRVILENELRAIITRMMAVDIAHDTMRGPVYCGLRFVP
jgi:glutamate dehydrogenase/leucine dehydrogenase